MSVDRELAAGIDRAQRADADLRTHRRLAAAEPGSGSELARRIDDRAESGRESLTSLAEAALRGDAAARQEVVSRSLPAVAALGRRYAGADAELADLVQEGIVGLLRALERFDPGRGVPFEAYARWWIRQAMQQAVAEQSRALRLPTHVLWDLHDVKRARGELLQEGARADAADLARRLDWSTERLARTLLVERPAASLDAPRGGGDGGLLDPAGELLADPLSAEAFEEVIERVSVPAVRALLSTLTERERQVLRWRFGMDGDELSLRQIGRRLGMSAERVRQIEGRALVKLRSAALPPEAVGSVPP